MERSRRCGGIDGRDLTKLSESFESNRLESIESHVDVDHDGRMH